MKATRGFLVALLPVFLAVGGCSSGSAGDGRNDGGTGSGGQAGTAAAGSGGRAGEGGTLSSDAATSSGNAGASGSGGLPAGGGGGTTSGAGGVSTGGTIVAVGSGGSSGVGGNAMSVDASGPVMESADLIVATLDNGWLQLFNTGGPISAFGPWSTSTSAGSTCTIAPTGKPPKTAKGMCFSGQGCGAKGGASLSVQICMTYPAYQHWTVMVAFVESHGMSGNNVSYGFGSCNTGHKITAINWEGAIPAGVKIDVHDPAGVSLGAFPVTAGATSVTLPATVDGGKIASIHFVVDSAIPASWDYCISKLTFSYR